jgi:nucleotide-binding universal stress UspA family protein
MTDLDQMSPDLTPLVLVVGYDGSEPSRRALDRATALLRGREGELQVIYVAHIPAATSLSAEGLPDVQGALDDQAKALGEEVRARLSGAEQRWHFQRRDGAVDRELMAAAADLHDRYGDDTQVVIILGGSAHWYHHLPGSVTSSIVRHDRFPVVVVP